VFLGIAHLCSSGEIGAIRFASKPRQIAINAAIRYSTKYSRLELLLDLHVSKAEIARTVRTSRQTVYAIAENLNLWGLAYPPKDSYRTGRLPNLTVAQVQVGDPCRHGM
jgi:hypothetical protein